MMIIIMIRIMIMIITLLHSVEGFHTDMKAEHLIESLANYIWFLRVPNAVCISHRPLIGRRKTVEKTLLGLTSETTICNNLTAEISVKCIKWFAICAFLMLTDLISLISICRNVNDHKLDWDTRLTHFLWSLS